MFQVIILNNFNLTIILQIMLTIKTVLQQKIKIYTRITKYIFSMTLLFLANMDTIINAYTL